MSTVDLSRLSAPDVVEALDYEAILAERKARLIELTPAAERAAMAAALELESEPIVKLLQESAYRELVLRQRINEAARAVMLAWASGTDLDHLAANYEVERLVLSEGDSTAVPPVDPTYESDDELRARVQQAFEGLSVAGPRGAYEYHALSADGQVADVSATSPAPAQALVTVLSREGDGTASAELLAAVSAALNDEDVRPVADRLTVQSASIVDYSIAAVLHLYPGPEAEPILAEAQTRASAYAATQRRIGRDIRLSAIYAALHVEGVQRVELLAPLADIVLSATQASHCTAISIEQGADDE